MRLLLPLTAMALVAAWAWACDNTTSEPTCTPDVDCAANGDSSVLPDGQGPISSQDDGGAQVPFDSGTTEPPPTCKGLLELCSAEECCSPYGCVNGTCR